MVNGGNTLEVNKLFHRESHFWPVFGQKSPISSTLGPFPKTINMAPKTLKNRSDVPEEHTWDLSRLYESVDGWEKDLAALERDMTKISDFQGKLGDSNSTLAECIRLEDELDRRLEQLYTYSHLRHDEDTADTTHMAMHDRARNLAVRLGTLSSYIVPEILSLPDDRLDGLLDDPELAFARVPLGEILRTRQHYLSPPEEMILAMASDPLGAASKTFSLLNDADMKFPTIKDEEGSEVELTHGRYTGFMMSAERRVRKDAMKALYGQYRQFKNTYTSTLDGQMKKLAFLAKVRKYKSAREGSLDDDHVTEDIYDTLIDTVRDYLPAFYRYVSLRKRMLCVDDLHMYDVYAPLIPDFERDIPYDEAVDTVRDALAPLGDEVGAIVDKGFSSRWIDRFENRNKRSGAYSSGCFDSPPYILLNYDSKITDLFTMAHEMGHSVHSYLSNHNQPHIQADYPIFLAEVASTVNENLLVAHLRDKWDTRDAQAFLVNHHLEGFKGTVFRQTMFAEFERDVAAMVERGEPLTPDILSAHYRKLNVDYFGPEMAIDPEIDLEWSRIPHFYYNFYVYKYATGYCAATALSRMILDGDDRALDRYLTFLRSGGSKPPLDTLADAGVDLRSPEPVKRALDVFSALIDEMEELVD